MTDNKPIDLGKLQDAVKAANSNLSKCLTACANTRRVATQAADRHEVAQRHATVAREMLEKAKQAMLDGARTVASS